MSKREELREKRRRQQQRQRTFMIVAVAVVAVVLVAVIVVPGIIANSQPIGQIVTVTPLPYPNMQGMSIGDPNAPVKVVEYSDYQCPYCKAFHTDYMPGLVKDQISTGKVYFTYVPFEVIGPESNTAAEGALCAGDQNKFWQLHDVFFANQGSENSGKFSEKRVQAMAQTVSLDMTKFNQCFSSHKYQTQLTQYQLAAQKLGVTGTPSFTINGKLISYTQQKDIINQINAAVNGK